MPSILIPMADYGHDPTEVAVPFQVFQAAGFDVVFATENGKPPQCDKKMLEGVTGALLGATSVAKKAHNVPLSESDKYQNPLSWADPSFSLDKYDAVFLPGGHEKGVRQVIESDKIHRHLQAFFGQTLRSSGGKKVVGAICHGVQILAFTPDPSSPTARFPLDANGGISPADTFTSIIHDCRTTALPGFMESGIYQGTRLFLGDYYKTYGAGTPTVEDYVKHGLDEPTTQFETGPGFASGKMGRPFLVEDDKHRYVSGRFPPDAEAVATRVVELVTGAT